MITATTAPKHWYEIDPTKYNKLVGFFLTEYKYMAEQKMPKILSKKTKELQHNEL
jgi:hypothetical protein